MWMSYAPDDTDAALLEWLRSGDSIALEELFLRHYATVYRVLYGVVGNAQEAEDLAQETLMVLYRQPPRLDDSGELGGWLYRVAVNRAYNALRSNQRLQRRLERVELEQQSDPQDEYVRREERTRAISSGAFAGTYGQAAPPSVRWVSLRRDSGGATGRARLDWHTVGTR
jgi:RNA polymerase sigma-70 factor (ECF subfamily)